MEYVEEEFRPRFLFQYRPMISSMDPNVDSQKTLNKLHVIISFSISILLLYLSFFSQSQSLTSLLVWTSLSLLLSPFAPSSLTGGDPRVGLGEPLPLPPPPPPSNANDPVPTRRIRSRNKPDTNNPPTIPTRSQDLIRNEPRSDPKAEEGEGEGEDSKEWTDDDFEILKKEISKHPVGEPRRWEKIAEAFNGRHKLESVIKMGKTMHERRPENRDSFVQFLKQRKLLDKRVEKIDAGGKKEEVISNKEKCWSSSEDIALLNALKTFSKDVSMRWEKVAAAVPGRSKGECVKRVSELKRDFRSSKASES